MAIVKPFKALRPAPQYAWRLTVEIGRRAYGET